MNSRDRVVYLDLEHNTIDFAPGVVIPARPFWGDIKALPPSMGRIPPGPPNVNGGNMDNHDLQPGTSLFLPVHVLGGALLAVSDGHAAQGNGEVGMSASWNRSRAKSR